MYLSKPMATRLAEVAKVEGSPLQQSYRNTIYCNATLSQESGKIIGTYCGNRWCMTCSRIRTALAIQRYLPVLKTWSGRQFVTLTVRNVPADRLAPKIEEMLAAFTAAKRGIKRTDNLTFKALRKLECTYNPKTDEYHPHFHVQVEGRRAAELLVDRWLEYFPSETDRQGQDIRSADDDDSLLELFKYFTKLMTKQKMMPVKALDIIFRSIRGRRVYQPVGFVAPKDTTDDEGDLPLDEGTDAPTRPDEVLRWVWSQSSSDWIDASTGECLSGYEPNDKFRELVESIGREAEQPELVATVRGLPPEEKIDEAASMEAMRRRMNALERTREQPMPEDYVSKALQTIFDLSAERAREMAAYVAPRPDSQLGFFAPGFPAKSAANSSRSSSTRRRPLSVSS
jgi:hypothetical protein